MGAELDANLHQPVGKLEQIRDANLPSIPFPLLYPQGELGWYIAVSYQGGTTSYNNNRILYRICRIPTLDQVQWVLIAQWCLKIVSVRNFHTVLRVPSLLVSPGTSRLSLLLLLLLLPVYYSH
jgi:hypothetical protein